MEFNVNILKFANSAALGLDNPQLFLMDRILGKSGTIFEKRSRGFVFRIKGILRK